MSAWVYIKSEPGLWTVGFYKPDGEWEPESDHRSEESAARRVHWLNGGRHDEDFLVEALEAVVEDWDATIAIGHALQDSPCTRGIVRKALAKVKGEL